MSDFLNDLANKVFAVTYDKRQAIHIRRDDGMWHEIWFTPRKGCDWEIHSGELLPFDDKDGHGLP